MSIKKILLVVAGLLAAAGLVAARREVADAEARAALWAEATDTLDEADSQAASPA